MEYAIFVIMIDKINKERQVENGKTDNKNHTSILKQTLNDILFCAKIEKLEFTNKKHCIFFIKRMMKLNKSILKTIVDCID